MKIGYARVSTDEQHLDLQLSALQSYGCDIVFSDSGISGASFDRPGLGGALAAAGNGCTLVVWRLDRLGRSLSHLIAVIGKLSADGVHFVSLTESIGYGFAVGSVHFPYDWGTRGVRTVVDQRTDTRRHVKCSTAR